MDLLTTVSLWTAVIFIIFSLLYSYLTWNYNYWEKQGIAYDKPLPIFGNVSLKMTVDQRDVSRYKKYGRIFGMFDGRNPALVVGDKDLVKQVLLKDSFSTFTNHRNFELPERQSEISKMLFNLRDDEWKNMRNILTPTFTSGKLKQMVEQVEDCIGKLINNLATYAKNNKPVNVINYFKGYTLDVIANCVFGIEVNSIENVDSPFLKHSQKLFENSKLAVLIFLMSPKLLKYLPITMISQDSLDFFRAKVMEILELRKTNKLGRKCFVDLLLQAQNEQSDKEGKTELTETIIVAQCISFFFAGLETSSITLSFITHCLAMNPDIQEKLISEVDETLENNSGKITYNSVMQMQYLDMVISETLRMFPPLTRLDRECLVDNYKIGNATLRKSMVVYVPVYCIHYDEEYYPNPHEFNPDRFSPENKAKRNPYTYLPFGSGPRTCIASRFALMQIKLTLAHLLTKYRFVTCSETEVPLKIKQASSEILTPNSVTLMLEMRNH